MSGMMAGTWAVIAKDLRLACARGQGPVQAVLLGLLLVFIFSLSAAPGEHCSVQQGMAIFWLCSSFAVVLIFAMLFRFEAENDTGTALLLSPLPVQGLWLGKTLAGLMILLGCQVFFLPASVVFLDLSWNASPLLLALAIFGVDLGLCIVSGLVGAMGQGHGSRDALLTIIIFPLQVPLLLSGIRIGVGLMQGAELAALQDWLGMVLAFDAVFAGAALFLFPHVFRGE
ncbi:heme exporter protein CcmB [Desulfovibrionales bacterium]